MNLLPYMEQWNMLPESGGVILCAVSGGRDSMCLLDYLHHLGNLRFYRGGGPPEPSHAPHSAAGRGFCPILL